MKPKDSPAPPAAMPLCQAVDLAAETIINPQALALHGGIVADSPVLVVLAAGMGKRFGQAPIFYGLYTFLIVVGATYVPPRAMVA